MLTYPETQVVPLTTTKNGVIRIAETRIGLDVDDYIDQLNQQSEQTRKFFEAQYDLNAIRQRLITQQTQQQ